MIHWLKNKKNHCLISNKKSIFLYDISKIKIIKNKEKKPLTLLPNHFDDDEFKYSSRAVSVSRILSTCIICPAFKIVAILLLGKYLLISTLSSSLQERIFR